MPVVQGFASLIFRLHLIEFRSTAIFLSPRIKYVSIHRESKRDLICKTQSHVQFIWIQDWGWRMEVTNISSAITSLAHVHVTKTKTKTSTGRQTWYLLLRKHVSVSVPDPRQSTYFQDWREIRVIDTHQCCGGVRGPPHHHSEHPYLNKISGGGGWPCKLGIFKAL